MTESTIVVRKGYLYLRHADPMLNAPVMLVTYYPTDLQASSYDAHLDGMQVRGAGLGRYTICKTLQIIHLPQGGDTLSIAEMTEKTLIKKPRKGKNYDWVWRWGKWEKSYS